MGLLTHAMSRNGLTEDWGSEANTLIASRSETFNAPFNEQTPPTYSPHAWQPPFTHTSLTLAPAAVADVDRLLQLRSAMVAELGKGGDAAVLHLSKAYSGGPAGGC